MTSTATGPRFTNAQRTVLVRLAKARLAGDDGWHRSARHGERPTYASLYYRHLLERRAWRGTEGEADAAYEYRLHPLVLKALQQGKP